RSFRPEGVAETGGQPGEPWGIPIPHRASGPRRALGGARQWSLSDPRAQPDRRTEPRAAPNLSTQRPARGTGLSPGRDFEADGPASWPEPLAWRSGDGGGTGP